MPFKRTLYLFVFVSLSLTLFSACGDRDNIEPNASFAELPKLPSDQVIVGFAQYVTQSGKNKATLLGDTAYVFEDSAVAKVTGVRMTIYDEAGRVNAKVKARTGDFFTGTQRMIARGNVVLTTNAGRQIESEEIYYDPQSHRIWSTKPTRQRYQGGVLSGSSFDADDQFVNVRINNARSSGGGFKITF